MNEAINPDVLRAAQAGPRPEAGGTTLQRLRKMVAEFRDKKREKVNAEERLKEINTSIYQMERKDLPDMLDEAGVPEIVLEAEGNEPRVKAKAEPYYKANIAAEWEPQRRDAAFKWLDDNGHGDLIKTDVTLTFAREDRAMAVALTRLLRQNPEIITNLLKEAKVRPLDADEISFSASSKENVPWNTLTSWLREMVEKGKTPPLETIGGEVGRIVKLKEL